MLIFVSFTKIVGYMSTTTNYFKLISKPVWVTLYILMSIVIRDASAQNIKVMNIKTEYLSPSDHFILTVCKQHVYCGYAKRSSYSIHLAKYCLEVLT